MSKVFIEESTLTAIGNAIRAKSGGAELISPADMATEIANLPSGGNENVSENNLTGFSLRLENAGSVSGFSQPINYDGYSTLTFKARRRSPLKAYNSSGERKSYAHIYYWVNYVCEKDMVEKYDDSASDLLAIMDSDDIVTYTLDLTQPPFSTAEIKQLCLLVYFVDEYTTVTPKGFDIFDMQLSGSFAHQDNPATTWSSIRQDWMPGLDRYRWCVYTELINLPTTETTVTFQGYATNNNSSTSLTAYIDVMGLNKETKVLESMGRALVLNASSSVGHTENATLTFDGTEKDTYEKVCLRLMVINPSVLTDSDSGYAIIRNITFSE